MEVASPPDERRRHDLVEMCRIGSEISDSDIGYGLDAVMEARSRHPLALEHAPSPELLP